MSPRASKSEPATRAGVIAAGLVRIVHTPPELDAAGGWWSAGKPSDYPADVKRARSEGMKAGLPRWLAKPVTPRDAVARMFRDAESERRAACRYIGGKVHTPPSQMTPTQLRAALGTQHRRLSGGWGDAGKGFDVEVSPPDTATLSMLAAEPEPVVVAALPEPQASEPEPVSEAVSPGLPAEPSPVSEAITAPLSPEPKPVPVATPKPRLPAVLPPEPIREPEPVYRPAGRDRLAWVPVMARLAAKYAKQGYETRPQHRGTL